MVYDGLMVGQNIKELRTRRHMTLEDMSEKLEMSYSHLSQIEQGSRRMSLDLLLKVVTVFGCKVTDVLGSETELAESRMAGGTVDGETTQIDTRLASLPVERRVYLMNLFNQMIDTMPA